MIKFFKNLFKLSILAVLAAIAFILFKGVEAVNEMLVQFNWPW